MNTVIITIIILRFQLNLLIDFRDGGTFFQVFFFWWGGGGGGLTSDLKWGAEETLPLLGLQFCHPPAPLGSAVPGFSFSSPLSELMLYLLLTRYADMQIVVYFQ